MKIIMHYGDTPYRKTGKILYGKRVGAKLLYKEGGFTLPVLHLNIGGKKKEAACSFVKLEELKKAGKYQAHYWTDGSNMFQLNYGAWVDTKTRVGARDVSLSEALQQDKLSRKAKEGILSSPLSALEVVKALAIIALIIMTIGAYYMLNNTYTQISQSQSIYKNTTVEITHQNMVIDNLTSQVINLTKADLAYRQAHGG